MIDTPNWIRYPCFIMFVFVTMKFGYLFSLPTPWPMTMQVLLIIASFCMSLTAMLMFIYKGS